MEPEVAVMVSGVVPVGVNGTKTALVLLQPPMKLRMVKRSPKTVKRLMACAPAGA